MRQQKLVEIGLYKDWLPPVSHCSVEEPQNDLGGMIKAHCKG